MGADTFVHMTFARHMSIYTLDRRRHIYEEACRDLGLEFIFINVPDPASEIGLAGAQQAVYDMMPGLIERYGKDAVYFTTNLALHEPVIKRVIEFGALFVSQDYFTPNSGYPAALGLDEQTGDGWDITEEIEKVIVAKGQSGRMSTWPYSLGYCSTASLYQLAVNIIEGKDTGNLQKDIVTAYQSIAPGGAWAARVFTYSDGNKIRNYYLLSMDTYIFGKGFSGVLSQPLPEKYLTIQ